MFFVAPSFAARRFRKKGVWATNEVAGHTYVFLFGQDPIFVREDIRLAIRSEDVCGLLAILRLDAPPF